MSAAVFHVDEEMSGRSLEAALRAWKNRRDDPAGLVRQRRVQVNGNLCLDGSRRLRTGDVVRVLQHSQAAPPREADIAVRFLDPHLVVVDKPAGMTTMRYGDEVSASGRRDRRPTLLELLPRVLAKRLGRIDARSTPRNSSRKAGAPRARRLPPPRILPVHRLDRETSGLMVFARTPAAGRALSRLFREHEFERIYLAVVAGNVEPQTIESFLADDRGDGRRGSVDDPARGKRAVTHVARREQLDGFALVECRLETGRTHQIRIHLAERGHPLCGDRHYRAAQGNKPLPDRSGAPRLALHAAELEFRHPITGQELRFRSPLPVDLAEFLDRLRRK